MSASQSIFNPPPLSIAGLAADNQLVIWNSSPNVVYVVLATTDLTQPWVNISGNIPSQGTTTSFYDSNPSTTQKFYMIEAVTP